MLLDGGLRGLAAELLDVRRDRDRFDLVELEPRLVALVEEPLDRPRVRHAGVAIADAGGEEFDEAAAGALALGANNEWQRIEAGPDQRRRWYDLFG
jgi:hypothetical protein